MEECRDVSESEHSVCEVTDGVASRSLRAIHIEWPSDDDSADILFIVDDFEECLHIGEEFSSPQS